MGQPFGTFETEKRQFKNDTAFIKVKWYKTFNFQKTLNNEAWQGRRSSIKFKS